MNTKHLKTKLFIAGLVTVQALCMIQGFSTTSDHVEFVAPITQVDAQEPVKNEIVKPQTVIEGVRESQRDYAKRIIRERTILFFGEEHVEYMFNIIKNESGFNPEAVNKISGACGLGQALPCGKMKCSLQDVPCQADWIMNYVLSRYENPRTAWIHWQSQVKIDGKQVGHWY